MNKKETKDFIELGKHLKTFLKLSGEISMLSRNEYRKPTKRVIAEHRLVGKRVMECYDKFAKNKHGEKSK